MSSWLNCWNFSLCFPSLHRMSTSKLLPGKSLLDTILGDSELAQMEGSVWADMESELWRVPCPCLLERTRLWLCSPQLGTNRDIVCHIQPLYSVFSHRLGYLVQSSQAQKTNAVVFYPHGDYPNISPWSTGDWGRSFPQVGGPPVILQPSYKGFRL